MSLSGEAGLIPDEDQGPRWLRDYGSVDFGDIAADIEAMRTFAAKLSADVKSNYAPHLSTVSAAMSQRLPPPPAQFYELSSFLVVHNDALNATHSNVYNYANGTQGFAQAATDISEKYAGSDAFSHAKVSDVDQALHLTDDNSGGMVSR